MRVWNEYIVPVEYDHGMVGICGLCGNSGTVDTTQTVKAPNGKPAGVCAFCMCPNGRALKKQKTS